MTVSHRLESIKSLIAEYNEPNYRYQQITDAIFHQRIKKYTEITALPQYLREAIVNNLGEQILTLKPAVQSESSQATKVLFELSDGNRIEAVRMRYKKGHTALCISSQVGCALACSFCSTGAIGYKRNLTSDEIVDQVLFFQQQGYDVKSISFMGMGEALLNPNTFDALHLLADNKLFNLSPRRLSVSTVGIIPGIERLTEEFPQVNLAFSLHSPFNEQRDVLVPMNRTYPMQKIIPVLDQHIRKTHRKVFIAYLVLSGYNDTPSHAKAIIDLFHDRHEYSHLYHVNLLRYNSAQGVPSPFYTDESGLRKFKRLLEDGGISVTARQSFGIDIDAACGQLYGQYEKKRHLNIV